MYFEKNAREKARELVESGIDHLKKGNTLDALTCIERSISIHDASRARSYLGLLIARERGKIKEGLTLCHAAVDEEPENPEFYLNLGKVLYIAGEKQEAIATVRKGLICGPCDDAVEWLDTVGVRRRPIISFLPRKHWLNKYAGIVFSKLGFK